MPFTDYGDVVHVTGAISADEIVIQPGENGELSGIVVSGLTTAAHAVKINDGTGKPLFQGTASTTNFTITQLLSVNFRRGIVVKTLSSGEVLLYIKSRTSNERD